MGASWGRNKGLKNKCGGFFVTLAESCIFSSDKKKRVENLKDTKAKEEISNQWESKVREGGLSYRLIMEDVQTDHIMKLDQLPEEVPTRAMEAYLSKYLIQLKMTITKLDLSQHGLGEVETNEATVEHRGVRRYIPRMIWVGPGVRARVTSITAKPWDEYRVMCSLCKKEGTQSLGLHPTNRVLQVQSINACIGGLPSLLHMQKVWASNRGLQNWPTQQ